MLRKKLALFLVTAMVLTTSVPAAYAVDTVVDTPPAITSEVTTTSEGAITTSEGAVSSEGATTSEGVVSSEEAATSEGTISKEGAITSTPIFDSTKDSVMYHHLEELSKNIGARVASTEAETAAKAYIKGVFEELGFSTTVQPFHWTKKDKNGNIVKEGDSSNIIAVKPGKSDKQVIVGAHYDSVAASTGASDNASGVSVMLGAAERLKDVNTEYTIKFIAFGAEEVGLKGSTYYASQMSKTEIDNTVAMINLDTVLFGDKMYAYGNLGTQGWLCQQALDLAESLNLNIITQQGLNEEYPKGTTGDWSDHVPFKEMGLPWLYFESTNWDLKYEDGSYSTGDSETEQFGEIMHTERDNLDFMNEKIPGRVEDRLYSYTTLLYNLLKEINPPKDETKDLITVSTNLLSMSEAREINVSVDLGYTPVLENLTWTLGGKSFDDWKSFDYATKGFTGTPFIKFSKEPIIEGNTVKAVIKCELPFGVTNLQKRPYPRRVFYDLIGQYDLVVTDKTSNVQAKTTMKLNAYDSYHKQTEILPAIEKIVKDAKQERYIKYAPLGKSAEGRDIPFVIFAKNQGDVDKYLNDTLPMMLNNPADFIDKITTNTAGEYKPAIWFNNIHSDEANGVDAQIDLLEKLATQDEITFKRATKNHSKDELEDVTLNVQELLDNYIILFSLNNNPDGRFYNNRETASGFDPNRDVTYQTQVEMANVFQGLAKWSPMIFNDFHGFVPEFLIEPCTPPHEPNFEYDLLMEGAIDHAHALGRAGIANTKYSNYIIPMYDYKQGWDDGAPMYAAVLALMHGALGHTVEIPELNQDSNNAFMFAGLGSLKYALENKEKLFKNQLEIYKRGVEGIDSTEVDKWLVNAKGESIGRPRGTNENFFPEYYVLPVNSQLQKSSLAAYEMADFLIKNGIKVEKTNSDVQVGDVTYPSGSFIVPMHQAKRGLANCVLYDGSDFSDFSEMYAEVTMCFPMLRGFDKYEIREAGAFAGKTDPVEKITIPTTEIPSGVEHVVIKNTNNDAIKAVNELLSANKTIYITYTAGEGFNKGDFIAEREDLEGIKDKYFLELTPFNGKATVKAMKQPKVAGIGSELSYVLKGLGFSLQDSYNNVDVIADDSSYGMPEGIKKAIEDGASYVAVGGYGMYSVQTSGLLPGFEIGGFNNSYEGVLRATLDTDSVITGRYSKNDILYNNTESWIEKTPATAKVLATISDKDDFYVAGWWPNHDEVKGKPYIIQDQVGDAKITVFASHITNKAHPSHQFRLLANAIYDGMPGTLTELNNEGPVTEKYTITVTAGAGGTISPSTVSVEKGADQEFTIKADTGYVIEDVEVDGKSVGAVGSYKFPAVTSTHTIKATFKLNGGNSGGSSKHGSGSSTVLDKYTITVSAGTGGTISPSTASVAKGSSQNFNIKPDKGYAVEDVKVDGKSVGAVTSYKFSNVTSTHTIKATFKLSDGTQATTEAAVKVNFKDVSASNWFSPAVNYVMQKGIMKGLDNNTFGPNVRTNRAMIVTMLYRLEGQPSVGNSVFTDVDSSLWYGAPVTWANSNGVVTGFEGNKFMPNGDITREQLACILYRYAKYKKADMTVKGNLNNFSDHSQVASYAEEAVAWAVGTGTITGKSGNLLDPKGSATRAEVAAMFQRIESLIN
nr:M20/M25/M40 family metallo-hydrolase [uncultured Aminipila sp.]